jgi:hypothetical protein
VPFKLLRRVTSDTQLAKARDGRTMLFSTKRSKSVMVGEKQQDKKTGETGRKDYRRDYACDLRLAAVNSHQRDAGRPDSLHMLGDPPCPDGLA